MISIACATRSFHSEAESDPLCHSNSLTRSGAAVVGNSGWPWVPIQVIQSLFPRLPITTLGMIRIDSSSSENEKEEKRTGPVPAPFTELEIEKVLSCSCHQLRASRKRLGPKTLTRACSPQATNPSSPRTQEREVSSLSRSSSGRCPPKRVVVTGIRCDTNYLELSRF